MIEIKYANSYKTYSFEIVLIPLFLDLQSMEICTFERNIFDIIFMIRFSRTLQIFNFPGQIAFP